MAKKECLLNNKKYFYGRNAWREKLYLNIDDISLLLAVFGRLS